VRLADAGGQLPRDAQFMSGTGVSTVTGRLSCRPQIAPPGQTLKRLELAEVSSMRVRVNEKVAGRTDTLTGAA